MLCLNQNILSRPSRIYKLLQYRDKLFWVVQIYRNNHRLSAPTIHCPYPISSLTQVDIVLNEQR